MELNSLPAEVIVSHPRSTLGHLYLDWNPQPGAYLEVEGQTYMVLERNRMKQEFLKAISGSQRPSLGDRCRLWMSP